VLPELIVTAAVELDPDKVRPGWVALGLVALLGLVLIFLLFSFAKHVRKAKEPWSGDEEPDDGDDSAPRSDDT